MKRRNETEMLDRADIEESRIKQGYEDLSRIHGWLADTATVIDAIRRDPQPVRKVLEVGCATGLILEQVKRELGVDVVGVDINPHPTLAAPVSIYRADASKDPLPSADVTFCMHLCHHLHDDEVLELILNVGQYCRRFIILDLIRHELPLFLFRFFVAPFVSAINAEDGQRSIRRAYTARELSAIVGRALSPSASTFSVQVARFYIRQVIDISYSPEFQRLCGGRLRSR